MWCGGLILYSDPTRKPTKRNRWCIGLATVLGYSLLLSGDLMGVAPIFVSFPWGASHTSSCTFPICRITSLHSSFLSAAGEGATAMRWRLTWSWSSKNCGESLVRSAYFEFEVRRTTTDSSFVGCNPAQPPLVGHGSFWRLGLSTSGV